MKIFISALFLLVGCSFAAVFNLAPGACMNDSNGNDTICAQNITLLCSPSSASLFANSTSNSTSIQCNATGTNSINHTSTATIPVSCAGSIVVQTPIPNNYCNENLYFNPMAYSQQLISAKCNITAIAPPNVSSTTSCTAVAQYITPQSYAQDINVCGVNIHTYAISTAFCDQYGTSSCTSVQNNYDTCMSNYNACTANYNTCTSSLSTANSDKSAAQSDRDAARVQFNTLSSIINSTKDELKACKNASLSTIGLNCKNAILPVCSDSIMTLCSTDEISKNNVPDCISRIKGENNESMMSCEIDSKACSDTLKAYVSGDQNQSNLENIIAMVAGTLIILLGGGALVVVYLKRKSVRDEIR